MGDELKRPEWSGNRFDRSDPYLPSRMRHPDAYGYCRNGLAGCTCDVCYRRSLMLAAADEIDALRSALIYGWSRFKAAQHTIAASAQQQCEGI